jgi:hypothetical protein
VYSLVSSSLLTIDLVRHPNGVEVADVLERTLRLTASDMNALQAAFDDSPERRAAWAVVQEATNGTPRLLSVLASVRDALNAPAPRPQDLSRISQRLSVAPMGNLLELLTMVERDVLDWTRETHGDLVMQHHSHAVAAVRDAIAAAYARAVVDGALCDLLAEPWTAVFGDLPAAAVTGDEYGPQTPAVRRAVDLVASLSVPDFERLNTAYWAAYTPEVGWAPAMHAASWAASMSGRLRPVAGAQLALLRAMLIAGLPHLVGASGVMMAGTAAMQATVLADVLDTQTYEALTAAWVDTFGPLD